MGDDQPPRRTREVFAGVPEAIPRARHLVADRLRAWGLDGFVDAIELAVAELVTNAVRHGKGPIELVVAMLPDRVRLEVHDHGGGQPAIRPIRRTGPAMGGWGLRMVDQIVDAWGTDVHPGRTVVWIEHTHT